MSVINSHQSVFQMSDDVLIVVVRVVVRVVVVVEAIVAILSFGYSSRRYYLL